jgi:hypothetical protein
LGFVQATGNFIILMFFKLNDNLIDQKTNFFFTLLHNQFFYLFLIKGISLGSSSLSYEWWFWNFCSQARSDSNI